MVAIFKKKSNLSSFGLVKSTVTILFKLWPIERPVLQGRGGGGGGGGSVLSNMMSHRYVSECLKVPGCTTKPGV